MALSFCLAQEFLDKPLLRDKTVDGSLNGMGRTPGNLPIELVADYCNENLNTHYDLDEIMDAIQDHIAPIKGESAWAIPRPTSCPPGSTCTAITPSITSTRAT